MPFRERTRDEARNLGGLISPEIPCGRFVVATCVGGFEDSTTGWKAFGPKAIVDNLNPREIVGLTDLPVPVQLFHTKLIRNPKDTSEIVEVGFNVYDEAGISDGIQRAFDVGILRAVPDADVEKYYPDQWAKRRDKYVYDWRERHKPQTAILDLLDQATAAAHAQADLEAAREAAKSAHSEAAQAAAK
ncbi:MAG TPA: hypothetical protein VJP85_00230 [Candidatus Baltobacteraceae bacterium]|nr:hypothetical protein [Candidatus Baltobacteraceae bacterium]